MSPQDSKPAQPAARCCSKTSILGWIFVLLALVNIGVAVRDCLKDRFGNSRRPKELKLYAHLDDVLERVGRPRVPVFLKFDDFSANDIGFGLIYFRAVFDLFPIPVLVAEPTQRIFYIPDIFRVNVERDERWLEAHQIGIVLHVQSVNGSLILTPHPVQAASRASQYPQGSTRQELP